MQTQIKRICEVANVEVDNIISKSHKQTIFMQKSLIAYLLNKLYKYSYRQIADEMNVSHVAIFNRVKQYDKIIKTDMLERRYYNNVCRLLHS